MKEKQRTDKPIKSKLLYLMADLDKPLLDTFQKTLLKEGSLPRDTMRLFNYLLKFHPKYDNKKELNKKFVFQIIFKTPFNYAKLMKAISALYGRLKDFLIEQELEKNTFLKRYLLTKSYIRYGIQKELQKELDKQRADNFQKLYAKFSLESILWSHIDYYYGIPNKLNGKVTGLKEVDLSVDYYFVGLKLRYLCELTSQKQIITRNYKSNFESELLDFCDREYEQLPNYHKFYYLCYQLIKNPKSKTFQQLAFFFKEHWSTVTHEDQIVIFSYLINYTSILIRQKNKQYLIDAFELYKFGFDKEILIINASFPEEHLMNLVSLSSYAKEYHWTQGFLKQKALPIKQFLSSSVYYFSLARLAFAQQKWEECKIHLVEVNYNNYSHFYRAKILEIACAYELKELMEHIEALCKSLENFCRRKVFKNKAKKEDKNKASKDKNEGTDKQQQKIQHKQNSKAGLNFVRTVRQLNKLNPKKEKIIKLITSFDMIVFQDWLFEKID